MDAPNSINQPPSPPSSPPISPPPTLPPALLDRTSGPFANLLAAYFHDDQPSLIIADTHGITLRQLIAWSNLPITRYALSEVLDFERRRAHDLAARNASRAAQFLANILENAQPTGRSAEPARKAASSLLRIAGQPPAPPAPPAPPQNSDPARPRPDPSPPQPPTPPPQPPPPDTRDPRGPRNPIDPSDPSDPYHRLAQSPEQVGAINPDPAISPQSHIPTALTRIASTPPTTLTTVVPAPSTPPTAQLSAATPSSPGGRTNVATSVLLPPSAPPCPQFHVKTPSPPRGRTKPGTSVPGKPS